MFQTCRGEWNSAGCAVASSSRNWNRWLPGCGLKAGTLVCSDPGFSVVQEVTPESRVRCALGQRGIGRRRWIYHRRENGVLYTGQYTARRRKHGAPTTTKADNNSLAARTFPERKGPRLGARAARWVMAWAEHGRAPRGQHGRAKRDSTEHARHAGQYSVHGDSNRAGTE